MSTKNNTTSLKIACRNLTAEANGLPAVGFVALVVIVITMIWVFGPEHITL